MDTPAQTRLCARLLEVIEQDILPKTREGVAKGSKAFGSAILRKSDLSLIVADTNREIENPLFHGEISTLNAFYRLPAADRPKTSECLFITTHESCPLCLSAITWAGFDNFYYLFDYRQIRDDFHIPHNLKIMQEVFKLPDGEYARQNAFWQSYPVTGLAASASGEEADALHQKIDRLKTAYVELAEAYQQSKSANEIPLN
ncbi:MAG: nucleoside deaminase [Rhodospirillaceae bacterium]|nr:nucleoside deaminase [Rhodospirillaceae bacterium]MBT5456433.1 nucleoside deaminase [Rhodospirillaceae bacterium]